MNEILDLAAGLGPGSTVGTYQVLVVLMHSLKINQPTQLRNVLLRDSRQGGSSEDLAHYMDRGEGRHL